MNPIVIATGARLTQLEMFGDLFERMGGIDFLIKINHHTPEFSMFGKPNAFLRVNLNGSHFVSIWLTC